MKSRNDLAKYFNQLSFKTGAEIGVAGGNFSEILCKSIPNLKLYCIDPWTYRPAYKQGGNQERHDLKYQEAKKRLSPYNVILIRKKSMDALVDIPDNSLDFVFIDGVHKFKYVLEDVACWYHKVRKGGIVAGHDYYFANTVEVIEALEVFQEAYNININLTEGGRHNSKDDKCPSWWFVKE